MVKTIYRVEKNRNYTMISNEAMRDTRLSFGARGLLVYLLSLPDDWEINTAHLIKQSSLGRDGIKRLLGELEVCGYLCRERVRTGQGRLGSVLIRIFESPSLNNQTVGTTDGKAVAGDSPSDLPATVSPQTALPAMVNPQLLSTKKKLSTKRERNTKRNEGEFASLCPVRYPEQPSPETVKDIFEHWQIVCDHPRAILDESRYGAIVRALQNYLPEQIKLTCNGYAEDDWAQGSIDDKKHDDIVLICKDAEHVERFFEIPEHVRIANLAVEMSRAVQ